MSTIDKIQSLLAQKGWQLHSAEVSPDKDEAVVLWSRDLGKFGTEWATHDYFAPNNELCWGHYFRDEQSAIEDYQERCARQRQISDRRAAA